MKICKTSKKMKNLILTLTFLGFTLISQSQNINVEKSIYEIQTGIFGIWFHNETRLSEEIALRSEVGLDSGIFGGSYYDGVGFLMIPVIALEPRWYYNLNRRYSKSRNTSGNSGNFISLKTSYNPNWFIISNYNNLTMVNQISIIPTWGIKRKIGRYFTYETGTGIGYRYSFSNNKTFLKNKGVASLNLHLRIGYVF